MIETINIQNRSYLGNKYRLLGFIKGVVDENCEGIEVIADLFAGTGAFSSAYQDKILITNDLLYCNYICTLAWFGVQDYDEALLKGIMEGYNKAVIANDNYMSLNFADTFFSKNDCRKIGYIREDIESLYKARKINERERALLITSLLYGMDKVANCCGHYDSYKKDFDFGKGFEMRLPLASHSNNPKNRCYNMDVNKLAPLIKADLVYLDPPYNSRQYCDTYHLLENMARWEKPEVYGVTRKMDRSALKSDYCTKKAPVVFENLIKSIKARYILLSYNNTGNMGNTKSNARLNDDDIMRILSAKGSVKVFSQPYRKYNSGNSTIVDNEERLFLCTIPAI